MARASDILAVATREIGTVEESGNRQKYGEAYGMNGVYWCMQFVWWCFAQVDKTLFYAGGKTASCGELMRWAQRQGKWVEKGFAPGDVLIYNWPDTKASTDHCGICESVSGQFVTAIEGNTSNGNTGSQSNGDGVYRRRRKLSLVVGAYRPDYEAEKKEEEGMELEEFKRLWSAMREGLQTSDAGDWSREAREWAVNSGLIVGGTETGEPNYMWQDLLTREQLVTVLYRFARLVGMA